MTRFVPKSEIYGQFSRIGKALASPARLEILDLLSQGEKTVEQLAQPLRAALTEAPFRASRTGMKISCATLSADSGMGLCSRLLISMEFSSDGCGGLMSRRW